jgi:hypothetical protein
MMKLLELSLGVEFSVVRNQSVARPVTDMESSGEGNVGGCLCGEKQQIRQQELQLSLPIGVSPL